MEAEDVRIGDWFTVCCELDLFQIETQDHLEYARALMADEDGPMGRAWRTHEEALRELRDQNNPNDWEAPVIAGHPFLSE